MWCTYGRCLRNHLKCHFLQIELNNWLVHMFQQSIKVSLIAVSVEQLIYLLLTRCCVLSFLRFVRRLQWWKPHSRGTRLWLTPSSHSRTRRITRARTHSTCLIGGSQTVQRYRDSRTCCVQCWPNHPIPARLSVSLASSMRLTMTIRRGLTPTYNHDQNSSYTDYIELSMQSQFNKRAL
jgi:hypothetical protein